MTIQAAVDIGGTFTDVILYDDRRGIRAVAKVSSDSGRPEEPFIEGCQIALGSVGCESSEVQELVHGTTIVTNALLEGKTARVGLLVTQGFRHLLEIGRQQRPSLYRLDRERPAPLVPFEDIIEIEERMAPTGKILIGLDKQKAEDDLSQWYSRNFRALAVSLLFAYVNPAHEKRLKSLLRRKFGDVPLFLSSEVAPEIREFERTSTTVISAAVAPVILAYLGAVQDKLKRNGRGRPPQLGIMHSGGGLLNAEEAVKRPHVLIESGPAAGLIGAEHLARTLGLGKVIAFDMGGTTAKAGLILEGKTQFSQEYEVGGELHHGGRVRGSGYPVRTPMVDVVECGAGAGSTAWIDKGGHLKVGPRSAGASPGPACYGKGGTEATVTDAHLILGRLSADGFLGGDMPLFPKLAARAVRQNVGRPLGMTLEKAAAGILEVANANMLRILRLVTVTRGHDPRGFTLVAYGGAGPMHATELADKLSIRHVIIPRLPGLFSTLGLLYAERSTDFVATAMFPVDDLPSLSRLVGGLRKRAGMWFEKNDVRPKDRKIELSADLRYSHQNYELNLPLPGSPLTMKAACGVQRAFHEKHVEAYGLSAPGEDIQVVHVRLRASILREKPRLPMSLKGNDAKTGKKSSFRAVWFKRQMRRCKVYDRASLSPGKTLAGPMIIQERESTTVVEPGWTATLDRQGHIHLRKRNLQ